MSEQGTSPSAREVEQRVDWYLAQDDLLQKLGAKVLPGSARHDRWGWSVSVGTEEVPPRTFEFVDRLATVSERYRDREHVEVLIAPSGVKPSEMR